MMTDDVLFKDIGGSSVEDSEWDLYNSECYGIRLEGDSVCFTANNKIVLQLEKSSFPQDIDFSSPEALGELLKTIREQGLSTVVERLNLPATT